MRHTREEFEAWLQAQEPRSRVVATEYGTHVARIGNGICDFCSVSLPPNARRFEARDMVIEAKDAIQKTVIGDYVSLGAWGACPTCAALVDAGDRGALLARGIAEHVKNRPAHSVPMIRKSITLAHATFWQGRTE